MNDRTAETVSRNHTERRLAIGGGDGYSAVIAEGREQMELALLATITTRPSEPGRLYLAPGWGRRLGLDGPTEHWTCGTCNTSFPVINNTIRCNGVIIDLCPWCRPDSAPLTKGRGR